MFLCLKRCSCVQNTETLGFGVSNTETPVDLAVLTSMLARHFGSSSSSQALRTDLPALCATWDHAAAAAAQPHALAGFAQDFLAAGGRSVPKLAIVAGDSLDKEWTIAHMQGRLQVPAVWV